MRTATILQRVSDFLERFPPFSYLEPDAIARLAGTGRVRFHERGETLFEQDEERDRWLRIIEKGSVRLAINRGGAPQVFDLRGEGDLLGMGGYIGKQTFQYTATAAEDTLLYLVDLEAFTREVVASPGAMRFLGLFFAAGDIEGDIPESEDLATTASFDWFHKLGPTLDHVHRQFVNCPPETPIKEAARLMTRADVGSVLIINDDKTPAGMVTENDLRNRVATGEVSVRSPISRIMTSPVVCIPPKQSVGDCILKMMRYHTRHLCITEDGTDITPAIGVMAEKDLMLFYGNNPMTIVREIRRSTSVEDLVPLRERVDALLAGGLRSYRDIDWYAEVATQTNRAIVQRILDIAAREVSYELDGRFVVGMAGSAGRHELLTRTDFAYGLLHEENFSESECKVLARIASKLQQGLETCGFHRNPYGMSGDSEEWSNSVTGWKGLFNSWISRPIETEVWKHLAFFDIDPLDPSLPMVQEVRKHVRKAIHQHPEFVRLLANDSLAHQPPLTLIEGYAVNARGLQLEELDLRSQGTKPISDVARVLQFDLEAPPQTSTLKRLAYAAEALPEDAEVFHSAARAFRVVLFFRALNGLERGDDGRFIRPASLSKSDQVLLKSAFRCIANLLQFAATRYGFELQPA